MHRQIARMFVDLLKIGEDGPFLNDFNQDPAIDMWFTDKVRRLKTGKHKYPDKKKKAADGRQILMQIVQSMRDLSEALTLCLLTGL